jgi:hypothetical protein
LTNRWFLQVEVKYLIAVRSYLLGGGIIEELVAWIGYKMGRVIAVEKEQGASKLDFQFGCYT